MGMVMGMGGTMAGGVTTDGNTQNVLRCGDWICHHCSGHNFANRTSCFTCQRPAAMGSSSRSHGGTARPCCQSQARRLDV